MTQPDHLSPHTVFVVPSVRAESMLTDLTESERASLNEWSTAQRGDSARGGAIDLMQWPGWEGVLTRRFNERFGVDPASRTSS